MEELDDTFFLDAVAVMDELDHFYDQVSSLPYNDLFNISSIYLPEVSVYCGYESHSDVTLDVTSTCGPSYGATALLSTPMGDVNLMHTASSAFPVIVGSGASLRIFFAKSDFIGPIHPLENHRLGGLTNGLNIDGIGTVHWKFRTKKGIITVILSAYYAPGARAQLLSPQKLFHAKQGITGRFIVEEQQVTLQFDKVGEMEISYDPASHFPIALAKNHNPGVAKVNLGGVIDDRITNLSLAGKLLLHWHGIFDHKSIVRVQHLLRAFPFFREI